MAQTGTTTATPKRNGKTNGGAHPVDAVISNAQGAAEIARQTAERAAARMPEVVAGAQVAARDTQRKLDAMDDQTLLAGTSFSLGLGIGLFVSGAHRLLVAVALVPAGAMALTLLGRERQ
jgi:hypothetical protein